MMSPVWFSFCLSDYFLSLHWLLSLYLPLQLGYPCLFSSYTPTHDLNYANTSIATYSLIFSQILLSPHQLSPELYIHVFSGPLDFPVECPLQYTDNIPITKLKFLPTCLAYSFSISVPMNGTTTRVLTGIHWSLGELQKGTLPQVGSALHQIGQCHSGKTFTLTPLLLGVFVECND